MFRHNKHLEALGATSETQYMRDFRKENGFDVAETYDLDYSLLCFLYTRLKAFQEVCELTGDERRDLLDTIDKLVERYEDEIISGDFDLSKGKSARKLIDETLDILNDCFWGNIRAFPEAEE